MATIISRILFGALFHKGGSQDRLLANLGDFWHRFNSAKNGSFYNCAFSHAFCELLYSAKNLIRQCLVLDPKQRVTASKALKHPWFREREENMKEDVSD